MEGGEINVRDIDGSVNGCIWKALYAGTCMDGLGGGRSMGIRCRGIGVTRNAGRGGVGQVGGYPRKPGGRGFIEVARWSISIPPSFDAFSVSVFFFFFPHAFCDF